MYVKRTSLFNIYKYTLINWLEQNRPKIRTLKWPKMDPDNNWPKIDSDQNRPKMKMGPTKIGLRINLK